MTSQTPIQLVNPYSLLDPSSLLYSHVSTVKVGNMTMIQTAGQIGVDKQGHVPQDDMQQVKLALDNLRACLLVAGATPRDIIKLKIFVVNDDPSSSPALALLYGFLGGHYPPSTCIPVKSLAMPGVMFEIEAHAVVQDLTLLKPLDHTADLDVIVIGAGLSGLQAAYDAQKAGLSCLVLESRDRVGGKTLTTTLADGKARIDCGGAWINNSNQWYIAALAKRFKLDLVPQFTDGKFIQEVPGKESVTLPYGNMFGNFSESSKEKLLKIFAKMESISGTLDIQGEHSRYDALSLQDWFIEEGIEDHALFESRVLTRAILGCEISEISSLYWFVYCRNAGGVFKLLSDAEHGGQFLRIRQGTQTISLRLADELQPNSVKLSTPAVDIIDLGPSNGTLVRTRDGSLLRAKRVIVSIPTPLYKTINFTPPLQGSKLVYASGTQLGDTSKVLLVYKTAWWRAFGLNGTTQSAVGPICTSLDSSVPEVGQYSLTCFAAGEPGRQWAKLGPADRERSVLDQIDLLFGPACGKIPAPVQVLVKVWSEEEWSQGCPCPFARVGVYLEHGHALREPCGNLHFVGTETADVWTGYMDGAVRSGARGAEEVIQALN